MKARFLLSRRRVLFGVAVYVCLAFAAMVKLDSPGLGIAHVLYIPVAIVALASGPGVGAVAGLSAGALWMLATALNANLPTTELFLPATGIRLLTFTAIGAIVGSAAKGNRILLERLREHAERDYLTDLLNVRAFETALAERLRTGRPFTLVLGDVDGLKAINDREGHAAGNDHLRRVAAALRGELAPDDVVARVGGDEFAILAWVESRPGARSAAARLGETLRSHGIHMSFGWSVRPEDGDDPLALFHAADKRLYSDKAGVERRGRARLHSVV